jgi:hypothetical protein
MGVNLPIQNYFKPKPIPQDWVRPSDWPLITDTANEVQFLMSDINQGVFTIRTQFTRTTGNLYIDWGDGSSIDTITTTGTTNTSHQYTAGTGTPCSRGYTTFVVRVYTDPTCVITVCQPVAPVAAGNSTTYQMGLLEVYYGNGTSGNAPSYGGVGSAAAIVGGFAYLEYVKLPQSVSWTTGTTFMFSQNQTIQKVILPTTFTSNTSFRHFFSGCTNLRGEYNLSMLTGLSGNDLESTFSGCINITNVILPSTPLTITTLASTFNACYSLRNITIPDIPNVTSFSQTFRDCFNLEWVKFGAFPSPASSTAITAFFMFGNCISLENVYFPATCSSNAKYGCSSMFISCFNLKTIILPLGFDATDTSSMFAANSSLTSVIFQNAFSACTNISSMFSACRNLYNVILPSDLGAAAIANNMFQNCNSLESITIPNTYNFTGNFSSIFQACSSVKTISLPNTAQNAITSLNSAFSNCTKLETVTLPSSMTGATDMTNMFSDCSVLKSVTFPSTMNSVTTMLSCFTNCFSLDSVTMPTSMSSCNVFNLAFNRCKELTTLTLPATVATGTNWASAFSQCINLKTLTLPTTQTTTLTDLSAAFNSCGSLLTINNTNKLGTLGATPLVNLGLNTGVTSVTSLTFSCPMSLFGFNGTASGFNALTSLRFLNTSSGQWTGASPQINVSQTSLSTAALVQLFNDMAAQGSVVSKTINITSATGAAGLTPANRAIITSIGWTITG